MTEISNTKGKYYINEIGEVYSCKYGKIKKLRPSNSRGYLVVSLTVDGVKRGMFVHRLVALQFIPNPNLYPVVNHKNGIKNDNRLENLEWSTQSMNTKHAYAIKKAKAYWKGKTGKHHCCTRKVGCSYEINGETIKTFDGMKSAGESVGVCKSAIWLAIKRQNKSGGLYWRRLDA